MNIGDAERLSGLPVKTIRYYEEIGLVVPARHGNGYRKFADSDIHKLRFLQRARGLGFSIGDCRMLLSLYEDENRASADVKTVAEDHLKRIEEKIDELRSLRDVLVHLIHDCKGDHRPDCPILTDLAGGLLAESRPACQREDA